jgi:hypothetical protein
MNPKMATSAVGSHRTRPTHYSSYSTLSTYDCHRSVASICHKCIASIILELLYCLNYLDNRFGADQPQESYFRRGNGCDHQGPRIPGSHRPEDDERSKCRS